MVQASYSTVFGSWKILCYRNLCCISLKNSNIKLMKEMKKKSEKWYKPHTALFFGSWKILCHKNLCCFSFKDKLMKEMKKKSEKWYRPHTALFLVLEKFCVIEKTFKFKDKLMKERKKRVKSDKGLTQHCFWFLKNSVL